MMFVDMISESGIDDLLDDFMTLEKKLRLEIGRYDAGSFGSVLLQQRSDNGHFAAAGELRLGE